MKRRERWNTQLAPANSPMSGRSYTRILDDLSRVTEDLEALLSTLG